MGDHQVGTLVTIEIFNGEAKRRLERTKAPVDEISWQVGYEDPAFFRRLFKRITGVTAGSYRRKFHIPEVEIL